MVCELLDVADGRAMESGYPVGGHRRREFHDGVHLYESE
jgi:hypothetical protein